MYIRCSSFVFLTGQQTMDRILSIVHRRKLKSSVSGQNMMNQTLTPCLKQSYLPSQTKNSIPPKPLERNSGQKTLVSIVNYDTLTMILYAGKYSFTPVSFSPLLPPLSVGKFKCFKLFFLNFNTTLSGRIQGGAKPFACLLYRSWQKKKKPTSQK